MMDRTGVAVRVMENRLVFLIVLDLQKFYELSGSTGTQNRAYV